MAKPKKSRDQEKVQEHPMIKELWAELQAIEERKQCAVRWHTLMNPHGSLELPVQYERLFRRSPTGQEEKTYDDHRGTPKSHRRRLPHSWV